MNSATQGRSPRAVRYTVAGRWRGMDAEVTWEDGRFFGPPHLVAKVRALAKPTDDLCRPATSLALIGHVLDEVQSLRVDDGQDPWDFDARPIRRLSAQRRRQAYEAAARPAPHPPPIA